jgi:hypothetical protein
MEASNNHKIQLFKHLRFSTRNTQERHLQGLVPRRATGAFITGP